MVTLFVSSLAVTRGVGWVKVDMACLRARSEHGGGVQLDSGNCSLTPISAIGHRFLKSFELPAASTSIPPIGSSSSAATRTLGIENMADIFADKPSEIRFRRDGNGERARTGMDRSSKDRN